MKKRNMLIGCFMILMLIATLCCASTSTQSGPGEYFDDSVITTKVTSEFAADDFLKSFEIKCGNLQGHRSTERLVDSQKAWIKRREIARGSKGSHP